MRGWTSDFTPYEPVAPATVRALPRDFDPRGHDDFLAAPRAAELAECDRCDWRLCNRLIRAEGRTVKPDCAAFLVMDGSAPRHSPRDPANVRGAVLRLLAGGRLPDMYEMAAALDMQYSALRKHVARMVTAGEVVVVGARSIVRKGGMRKLYALKEATND